MIEAIKQALALLQKGSSLDVPAAIEVLKQAEKQEPVAWLSGDGLELKQVFVKQDGEWTEVPFTIGRPIPMTPEHLPQYIATDGKPMESGGGGVCSRPRKEWVGLTDEEKKRHDLERVPEWALIIVEEILRSKNT